MKTVIECWGAAWEVPGCETQFIPRSFGTADWSFRKTEPGRPMLFVTRKQAREWCKAKNEYWREFDGEVSRWRVRPVKVVAEYWESWEA
jgi:hypothetical protein